MSASVLVSVSVSVCLPACLLPCLAQGYVFAPVIKALADVGYVEGVDLIAATFDWRFAPSVLEKRDGYFSSLIDSIETLNESNGPNRQRGVVLLAHSMGNKAPNPSFVDSHLILSYIKSWSRWSFQNLSRWCPTSWSSPSSAGAKPGSTVTFTPGSRPGPHT